MNIDVLVFAKPAQGCMCEVYKYPLELFLIAQIDQGARKETKTFASIPGHLVVKVNDAKRRRNKASVAHTTTPKKPVRIRVACNCFCNSWRKVKAESEAERSDH